MNPPSKARGVSALTPATTTGTRRHRLLAAISRPDFITIVAFCLIGLLLTLNVILRFPGLGSLIESYNQF